MNFGLRSARFFVIALLAVLVVHAGAAAAADAGVLIIHSNQRAQPATVIIGDALENVVQDGLGASVYIFREYLDSEWVSTEAYADTQADFLRQKYSGRNIRVIVVEANPALRFALKFRDRMFPGVPVVHVAIGTDQLEGLSLPADFVGKPIDLDPTETLRFALRLQPRAERIVIVTGAAPRDRIWEERARKAVARLEGHPEVEYLAGLPTAAVAQRLGALSKDTIVFTPGYVLDGAGHVSTPRQAAELIGSASAAPAYGPFDTFIGTGIVGGYMAPFDDQGTQAGALVVRLLNGTPPTAIARSNFVNVPVVDWRALRRWRIDEHLLPAATDVRFREPAIWEKYYIEISLVVAVLVIQTAMIASLLVERRRRRSAEDASSAFAGHMLTAHEDERRRLARDLHDDVTQRLARLAIDAGTMERATDAGAATARGVREELVRLSEDVHDLSYRLHPSVLDDLGLAEGLRAECGRVSRQASIPVNVDIDGVPARLPRESSLCLFRVAQEALRNVVRHAQASAITVSLSGQRRGLQLMVRDDGRGIEARRDDRPPSLGQMSMRERVRLVGGRFSIESAPGKGTTVTAWVPLEGATA
jgi:signal transduction histidine kinase